MTYSTQLTGAGSPPSEVSITAHQQLEVHLLRECYVLTDFRICFVVMYVTMVVGLSPILRYSMHMIPIVVEKKI